MQFLGCSESRAIFFLISDFAQHDEGGRDLHLAWGPDHRSHGHRHDAAGQPVPALGNGLSRTVPPVQRTSHPDFLVWFHCGRHCGHFPHRLRLHFVGQIEQRFRRNHRLVLCTFDATNENKTFIHSFIVTRLRVLSRRNEFFFSLDFIGRKYFGKSENLLTKLIW